MELSISLCGFDELAPTDLIACPYSCGAISPETEESRRAYGHLPLAAELPHLLALREMQGYLDREIKALISAELAGYNTAVPLYCAALSGLPLVDGDPAGRSVPGLQQQLFYVAGVNIAPMALCNNFGETAVLTRVTDDYRAEELVRAMAVVSNNTIAVVDHVHTAGEIGPAVIKGAISHTIEVGRHHREAVAQRKNAAVAVAEFCGGRVLYSGRVTAHEWDTVKGYTEGTLTVDAGGEYRIWYQNENIIAWKNGEYYASVPDLICVFNNADGMPVMNPMHQVGMDVTVIGIPLGQQVARAKGHRGIRAAQLWLRRGLDTHRKALDLALPPPFTRRSCLSRRPARLFITSDRNELRQRKPNLLQQLCKRLFIIYTQVFVFFNPAHDF